jgi:hypothetical protein
MWPHTLWSDDGAQVIAVVMLNVTGLALSIVAVVAYVSAQGWPRVPDWAARIASQVRAARRAHRARSRRLIARGQKAFLRYADQQADVLTSLADMIKRATDRANSPVQRRDPRLG